MTNVKAKVFSLEKKADGLKAQVKKLVAELSTALVMKEKEKITMKTLTDAKGLRNKVSMYGMSRRHPSYT